MTKKPIKPSVLKKRLQKTKQNLKQGLKKRILKHRDAQIEISQIERALSFASGIGGMAVHHPDWKPNTRFKFLITNLVFFVFVGYYTLVKVWGNLEEMCLALATYNFFFHGSCIIYHFVKARKLISSLYLRSIAVISEHKPLSQEGQCVLKYRNILRKIVILTVVLHVIALIDIVLYVIFGSILYDELTLPYGIYLPFVNDKTVLGFTINLGYQVVQTILVVSGFVALQIVTELFIIVAVCLCEIIIVKFEQLERLIKSSSGTVSSYDKQDKKLLDCIRRHQVLLEFFQDCEEVYSNLNAVAFICYDFQIIMLLFVVINEIYLPGYVMILVATLVLFAICLVGTVVQQKVRIMKKLGILAWSAFRSENI